jgi:glutamyl/glutaminyl-tRNA synthetase
MKKAIFSTICIITIFCLKGFSQDINETSVSFMDGKQNAVEAKYNFSEDIMETVVDRVLGKKSIKKTKSTKGYDLYQGVIFSDLCSDIIDFYIKVDGNKSSATITILISKGYNNFIASSSDASTIKNTKNLCKEFNVNAIEEHLNREIAKQEEIVKDAEKKYNKSVEKGKDLVKDKEEIIKKIGENAEEQKTIKADLEEQKKVLGVLKSKK